MHPGPHAATELHRTQTPSLQWGVEPWHVRQPGPQCAGSLAVHGTHAPSSQTEPWAQEKGVQTQAPSWQNGV